MSNLALIVEDDDAMRVIYNRVLTQLGYELAEVNNGADAIRFLEHKCPQLIFLDMFLPQVGGLSVLEFVRSRPDLQGVRVVIASSSNDFARYAHPEAGVYFMQKPLRPAQIRELAMHL